MHVRLAPGFRPKVIGETFPMDRHTIDLLYMLIGGVTLISLVAIVGGFLQCRRERLLGHKERMRALELGQAMPDEPAIARLKVAFGGGSNQSDDEEGRSPARKCFSTTLWIAFWGFLAAGQGFHNPAVSIAIAGSVGAIGVAGMIGGTILALRQPAGPAPRPMSKPVVQADEFDVVSCRG